MQPAPLLATPVAEACPRGSAGRRRLAVPARPPAGAAKAARPAATRMREQPVLAPQVTAAVLAVLEALVRAEAPDKVAPGPAAKLVQETTAAQVATRAAQE